MFRVTQRYGTMPSGPRPRGPVPAGIAREFVSLAVPSGLAVSPLRPGPTMAQSEASIHLNPSSVGRAAMVREWLYLSAILVASAAVLGWQGGLGGIDRACFDGLLYLSAR